MAETAEAENREVGQSESRTAGEAGWHVSRYNLSAPIPGTKKIAIANIFKGNCAEYTPIEMYLLSVLDELDEHHPIIERFAKRGIICNFDERAALETMGRGACAMPGGVGLTICPTMGCNFNCPYCFEDHGRGKMSPEVQDDVVALAERMLDTSGSKNVGVTWFGGEPLLAPDIIESLSERLMALAEQRGGEYHAGLDAVNCCLGGSPVIWEDSIAVNFPQCIRRFLQRGGIIGKPIALRAKIGHHNV